jgi:hypothetical protein
VIVGMAQRVVRYDRALPADPHGRGFKSRVVTSLRFMAAGGFGRSWS